MTNKHEIVEFSKVYKRVMDIELCLKFCFSNALNIIAPGKRFFRITPALIGAQKIIDINKYKNQKHEKGKKIIRNRVKDIINSSKTDDEKFDEFVSIAYLSDILSLISEYKLIYQNPMFYNNFYTHKVPHNDIKKFSSLIRKLRNIIMHFDIDKYKSNKLNYIETLAFWETQLHCQNCFIHNLPPISPTINNILSIIKLHYPALLKESDREIVDVFDDIAFINGLPVEKLPLYWSICRQIYSIKRK